jgi:UPF0755 protein
MVVLGGAALVGVIALGAHAIRPLVVAEDFDGRGSGTVTVKIPSGASARDVAQVLARAGVIAGERSFIRAVEARSKAGSLRAGVFRLRRGMSAAAALDLLLAPASRVIKKVTIPEGLRGYEVLERLAAGSDLPLSDFKSTVARPNRLALPAYARGRVEGLLFPATYEVEPSTTARELIQAMIDRFAVAARHVELEKRAAALGLTPLQAIIVASIVQAEGGREAEYPKIARVVYNRLARGAKLEMCSTVLYAQRRRTLRITERDTRVASPYNTYRHRGLPPGAISNPGESAMIAALHPQKGDWYWFVTTDPGRRITKFTDKEIEFMKYREELNRYLEATARRDRPR